MTEIITPVELFEIMEFIDRFYGNQDMVMISRTNRPMVAKLVFMPRMTDPPIYGELEYCVLSPGYGPDTEQFLVDNGEDEDMDREAMHEAVRHLVLLDTTITPSINFPILEDRCITESNVYQIAASMKKAGICPNYEQTTVKAKWIDNADKNIFAQVVMSLHGAVDRALKYQVGDYTFSINLGDEDIETRRSHPFYEPQKYLPHGLGIVKKGRKDYCGGGFKLHELASAEFADFNSKLQCFVKEFVIAASHAMTGEVLQVDVSKSILTPDEWEKEFYGDPNGKFEREYFPKAVEAIKKASVAVRQTDITACNDAQKDIFELVAKGLIEGGAMHMPGVTSQAYFNLLFASGYLAGLAIRHDAKYQQDIDRGRKATTLFFEWSMKTLMGNRTEPLYGELLIEGVGLIHDRNAYYTGLEFGIENKLTDINQAFNPYPLFMRAWSLDQVNLENKHIPYNHPYTNDI